MSKNIFFWDSSTWEVCTTGPEGGLLLAPSPVRRLSGLPENLLCVSCSWGYRTGPWCTEKASNSLRQNRYESTGNVLHLQGWGGKLWADMGRTCNEKGMEGPPGNGRPSSKRMPPSTGWSHEGLAEQPWINPGKHHERRNELEALPEWVQMSAVIPSQWVTSGKQWEGSEWTWPFHGPRWVKASYSPNFQFWLIT